MINTYKNEIATFKIEAQSAVEKNYGIFEYDDH